MLWVGPIILVAEVFPPAIGGSGFLLEQVYSRIASSRVHVITHGATRLGPQRRERFEVHHVPMLAAHWGLGGFGAATRHVRVAGAIRRLSRAVDGGDHPASLIHCARPLPEGLSARIAFPARKHPYLCWTHGEELAFASTSRELSLLTRWVLAGASAVVANSHNSARLLTGQWGVPAARTHVVHPGVDAQRFAVGAYAAELRSRLSSTDEIVLLSVGRLERRKGHDTALHALAQLRRQGRRVRYAVVGEGPERARLESQVRELGLGDAVVFAGAVSGDDLPVWYAAADIFVLPTRSDGDAFEGFGIVFLEAAAAGLPVVAGRGGGVPEAVEDGVTGALVSGTDVGELVGVLDGLCESSTRRRQLGVAGRDRVVATFSWQQSADRLMSVCRDLQGA